MTVAPRASAQRATSGSSQTTATGSGTQAATTVSAMERTNSTRWASGMVAPRRILAWAKPLTGMRTASGPRVPWPAAWGGRGAAATPADTLDSVRGGAGPTRGRRRLMPMSERVAVVGAGSWGTAVAGLVGANHPTSLWVRSPELADTIRSTRENSTYLPGVTLPDGLSATSSLEEALDGAGVVFMAVPSHGFRAVLGDLKPFADHVDAIISLSKGIENGTNLR